MKSKEIMKKIKDKRTEARAKMDAGDMTAARALTEEVRGLEEDLETALAIEEGELRDLQVRGVQIPSATGDETRKYTREDELRALGKHLLNMQMTDEERGLVTVAGNGALLPEGYVNDLMLLRDGYPSLKKYAHVIPVKEKTGKMPVANLGQNKLAKLSSDTPIDQGAVSTTQLNYDVEDYGKFVPIERSLRDDEVVGIIENILMPDFAEGAIAIENEEILEIIKSGATEVEGATDYDDVEKAIDSLVPSARAGAITITNTAGFVYLKNKKDTLGRKLNLITYVDGVAMFNNKPIVELSDTVVTASHGKLIYYVANVKEACKFFDRKDVEITKSTEFLFNKNQDCLRAIERFDVIKGATRSIKKIEFEVTP
ncbi:phage major capsid protein [Clostridium sp.]|uniref:phage major capsid protein n=1 Tax=Clostridium sp. TaxID=1506 RepID=UPI0025C3BA14|nr:phage major capsid protein [Clostridium sp.]